MLDSEEQPSAEAPTAIEPEQVAFEEPEPEPRTLPATIRPDTLGLRPDALRALQNPLRGESRNLPASDWVYIHDQTVGLRLSVIRHPERKTWCWCLHVTHGRKSKRSLGNKHLKRAVELVFKGLRKGTPGYISGLGVTQMGKNEGWAWMPLVSEELAALRQIWLDKGYPLEELDSK